MFPSIDVLCVKLLHHSNRAVSILSGNNVVIQEDLSSLVSLMGGTPYADLTRVTTHLVAGQVGTTKYHVSSLCRVVQFT